MHACLRCQEENTENRRYCRACGASLTAACKICGFANLHNDHYCGGCGKDLSKLAVDPISAESIAANNPSDEGIAQLLQEVQEDQQKQETTKKSFDQSELEDLFES